MTPQEEIAAAIVAELRRQDEAEPSRNAWIDDELGTGDVNIDGSFDLNRVGEALLDLGWVKPRRLDAAEAMAAATPVPPPSPATYASETHKDRTGREDKR